MSDDPNPSLGPPPPDAPDDDPTRTQPPAGVAGGAIGPYRLLQKVGEGGMGEVWLAEQTAPIRRQVALKVIKAGMDTKQVVARFEAERQALALMDHPAIAHVYDAGETDRGLPYFAMEYVKGEPITTYCDRQRLNLRERLELVMQVCEGVQHAHQKGIIHRDLKPSNVLVTIQDAKPVPKVIDFGVAKATAQRLTEKTMFTELGGLIGTPEYMSPEQAEMTTLDIDTRTDVYALGIILYQLLVGVLPFDPTELRKAGFDEIRRRIREVDPPRPSTRMSTMGEASTESAHNRRTEPGKLVNQLKGDLDWITMKALEKDRTRRCGSPSELSADIGRHLRHEPVLAGPPSAIYQTRKFVRRHQLGVAVAVLAVLALAGFAITMAVQAKRIARERNRAERVSEFLTDLFKVSDPSEARGNQVTAREILDKGVERIQKELGQEPEVQARLLLTMGKVYTNLGLWKKAEPMLQRSMQIRRRLLGEQNQETMDSMGSLGYLNLRQGRYRDAENLLRRTLEIRRRILGREHPATLAAMTALAGVYARQGRYHEAGKLRREVHEATRRQLGDDHPDTLWTMANLAAAYQAEGRLAEAEKLFRETLEARRRMLGADHPHTLWAMNDVADIYQAEGRYAEAERMFREVIEARHRVLGEEHPDTLDTMNSLAGNYSHQKRYDEAEKIFVQVLEVGRRVLGDEDPLTLASRKNLAMVYGARGQAERAVAMLNGVLAIENRVLGAEDPRTLISQFDLAAVHLQHGDFADAEDLFLRTLEVQRRVLGENHPDTISTLYNLACTAARQIDPKKALDYLAQAVKHGFEDARGMAEDPDLQSLRGDPAFEELLAVARKNASK